MHTYIHMLSISLSLAFRLNAAVSCINALSRSPALFLTCNTLFIWMQVGGETSNNIRRNICPNRGSFFGYRGNHQPTEICKVLTAPASLSAFCCVRCTCNFSHVLYLLFAGCCITLTYTHIFVCMYVYVCFMDVIVIGLRPISQRNVKVIKETQWDKFKEPAAFFGFYWVALRRILAKGY